MSDVIGTGFAGVFDDAAPGASLVIRASTPAKSPADATAGSGFAVISSKLKLTTSCTRPSSRTSKSDAVNPRTTAPDLSRTTTSTEMTSRPDRNTGRCCADVAGCSTATTVATTRTTAARREYMRTVRGRTEV